MSNHTTLTIHADRAVQEPLETAAQLSSLARDLSLVQPSSSNWRSEESRWR